MSLTQPELINKLKIRFNELDVDFDEFCKILIKYNAFISGSFLLQIIQNKYFDNSDIDIYTFGEQNKLLDYELANFLSKIIVDKIKNNKNKNNKLNDSNKIYDDDLFFKHDPFFDENSYTDHFKINSVKSIQQTISKPIMNFNLLKESRPIKIYNHYKNIKSVTRNDITCPHYSFAEINAIVNFESNNVLSKYQLIYYDNTKYNSPLEIIEGFDFDFCKNYFDGKIFYVKNFESINTSSYIIDLTKPRIYKNQNKRIVKYIERGFDIYAKYNNDIYNIIYLSNECPDKIKYSKELNEEMINLIIICDNAQFDITSVLNNLPINLEKLIIYTYSHTNIIDNLPTNLQELRLYIWKQNNVNNDIYLKKKDYDEKYDEIVQTTKNNIKRTPFDCKIFINDEIIDFTPLKI